VVLEELDIHIFKNESRFFPNYTVQKTSSKLIVDPNVKQEIPCDHGFGNEFLNTTQQNL
jgi:hypothetical protein